jgi:hypothetical protein
MEDSERRDRLTLKIDVEGMVPRSLALGQSGLELFEGLDLPIAGHGSIELSRQGDVIAGTFDVALGTGNVHLPWLGKVPLELAGGEIKATYEGPERRLVIAPSTLRWRASHATLTGEIAPALGKDGAAGWRFEAHGVDGKLTADDLGAQPLPLSGLIVRGTAFPASGHVEVSEFELTAGEAKVAMVGTIAASGSERVARLDGRIGPMSLEAMKTMWPQGLISYHVGSPWMFDGKTFFPDTGIPMRKRAWRRRPLALAEPVPLTVATFRAKSLTRLALGWSKIRVLHRGSRGRTAPYPTPQWDTARHKGRNGRTGPRPSP